MAGDGNSNIVFRVDDYEGTEITCSREQWMSKVERDHPELVGKHEDVRGVIANPQIVSQDRDYPDRKRHIRLNPDGLYLKVVTGYRYDPARAATVGRLVTAFYQDRLREGDEILFIDVRR